MFLCRLMFAASICFLAFAAAAEPAEKDGNSPKGGHFSPEQVIVIADAGLDDSMRVAEYYAEKRGVPAENILRLELGGEVVSDIGKSDYEKKVKAPVKAFIDAWQGDQPPRCIVTTYGMPYRIRSYRPADSDGKKKQALEQYHAAALSEFEQTWSRAMAIAGDPSGIDVTQSSIAEKLPKVSNSFNQALQKIGAMGSGSAQSMRLQDFLGLYYSMYGLDMTEALCSRLKVDFALNGHSKDKPELAELVHPRNYVPDADAEVPDEEAIENYKNRFGLTGLLVRLELDIDALTGRETGAALDSELAMVNCGEYSLYKWQTNELKGDVASADSKTLIVSRLDGPTADIACSLVDGAMIAEQIGLNGLACFDSRGYTSGSKPGLDVYDVDIVTAYRNFKDAGWKCILDRTESVFPVGKCDGTAVYCGWYSLKNYKPAFSFVPGAVGYHIASWEAVDMRNVQSNQWVPGLLNDGITATIGAVAEPYLQSFPLPSEFFASLLEGYSLGEAYFNTLPFNSWQQMLIGDPLYRPFGEKK
ncbi:hypothetical protein SMSP2_01658 [Limihaloglobus sulfuriphilus]|uniref:TIGR03790 family protein n=1 Tax=Limihaloglobus sulfuriphilus TaxID=1851148 RepID=A0A1Q2MG55_9BACT|nr:TIGR03790 family protein [Limihaloglobus sulfuriphilus]AQQ71287.1 hypothetical protein SMSP2_01658 [Limihaloglobus sulfuriphilus]